MDTEQMIKKVCSDIENNPDYSPERKSKLKKNSIKTILSGRLKNLDAESLLAWLSIHKKDEPRNRR